MRLRADCRAVAPPAATPALLARMVVIGEDSRFRTHHGFDFEEIRDAAGVGADAGVWTTARALWRHRDRVRGASTITQQLAKNLYLSPSRHPLRKLKEAVTAVGLELALSKDRILALYLSVAEWGPGVWGVAAASDAYFGVPPSRLTEEQAAALAATLPFPRTSNPVFQPARMLGRRDLILARYHGVNVYIPRVEEIDLDSVMQGLLPVPPIQVPLVPPVMDSLLDSVRVIPDSVRDTTRDTTSVHQP